MARRLTLAIAGLLLMAACGGQAANTAAPDTDADSNSGATSAPASDSPPPTSADVTAPAASSEMPDVTVVNVATGQDVALASLIPAQRPILLWFWAPH